LNFRPLTGTYEIRDRGEAKALSDAGKDFIWFSLCQRTNSLRSDLILKALRFRISIKSIKSIKNIKKIKSADALLGKSPLWQRELSKIMHIEMGLKSDTALSGDHQDRQSYWRIVNNLHGLEKVRIFTDGTWEEKEKEDEMLKAAMEAFGSSLDRSRSGLPTVKVRVVCINPDSDTAPPHTRKKLNRC
jgi:hypothetical protein